MTRDELIEVFETLAEDGVTIPANWFDEPRTVVDALVMCKVCETRGEARRAIKNGEISIMKIVEANESI